MPQGNKMDSDRAGHSVSLFDLSTCAHWCTKPNTYRCVTIPHTPHTHTYCVRMHEYTHAITPNKQEININKRKIWPFLVPEVCPMLYVWLWTLYLAFILIHYWFLLRQFPRLVLNSWSSCLCLQSFGITGTQHHAQHSRLSNILSASEAESKASWLKASWSFPLISNDLG